MRNEPQRTSGHGRHSEEGGDHRGVRRIARARRGGLAAAVAIGPHTIAGAKLGKGAAAYKAMLGAKVRLETPPTGFHDPDNYTRLVFPKRKINVYFKDGVDSAIQITTWNKAYKTAAGIGPCSSVAGAQESLRPQAEAVEVEHAERTDVRLHHGRPALCRLRPHARDGRRPV